MNDYESTILLKGDLPEEKVAGFVEKLKKIIVQPGGKILTEDNWGKKRLAYPIKKYKEGIYFILNFQSPPAGLEAVVQTYRISEEVLRHLTIKKEKEKAIRKTKKKKEVTIENVKSKLIPVQSRDEFPVVKNEDTLKENNIPAKIIPPATEGGGTNG